MKIKNKKDFGLGVFSVIASAVIVWLSMQLKATSYEGDPGPRMFPLMGAAVMGVCGLVLLIKQDGEEKTFLTPRQWRDAGTIFLIYIAMVVLLYLFGFIVAVPVILFVLTFVLSKLSMADASVKKRLISSLIYAIVAGALIYVAYVIGLQAALPKGIIWKLLK